MDSACFAAMLAFAENSDIGTQRCIAGLCTNSRIVIGMVELWVLRHGCYSIDCFVDVWNAFAMLIFCDKRHA